MNLVFVEPETFEFSGILKTFNVSDSAIDEGKGLDAFEPADDSHVAKVFKDEFNWLNFVDLFPLVVLESIHFFLG